jgi:YspA, cpYpsA-related SLOG family
VSAFWTHAMPARVRTGIGPEAPAADPVEVLPRVLVTGSRTLPHPGPVRAALFRVWDELGRPFVVVHGACPTGADAYADHWAVEHELAGIVVERHPADWRRFGKSAGPQRNAHLVRLGAYRTLAFPLGRSPGTRGCVAMCERAGIPVVVHEGAVA